MSTDKFTITILEDGTIKTTTDAVSQANHDNAENFLRHLATLAGGTVTRVARTDVKHTHTHSHGTHVHSHELDTHKH